jgi:hypothetical protein
MSADVVVTVTMIGRIGAGREMMVDRGTQTTTLGRFVASLSGRLFGRPFGCLFGRPFGCRLGRPFGCCPAG